MSKKTIWCFNGVMAVVFVVLLCFLFRKPSTRPYFQRLNEVAQAIQEYRTTHGEMPESPSDLGHPELASFRGNSVSYINAVSNFTLSISFPVEYGPKPRTAEFPQLPEGSRHVRTELSATYPIEEAIKGQADSSFIQALRTATSEAKTKMLYSKVRNEAFNLNPPIDIMQWIYHDPPMISGDVEKFRKLLSEFADKTEEEMLLKENAGEEHPDLMKLRSRIAVLQKKLEEEYALEKKVLELKYKDANQAYKTLQRELDLKTSEIKSDRNKGTGR